MFFGRFPATGVDIIVLPVVLIVEPNPRFPSDTGQKPEATVLAIEFPPAFLFIDRKVLLGLRLPRNPPGVDTTGNLAADSKPWRANKEVGGRNTADPCPLLMLDR
jgi:hypothetical protein